MVAYKAPLKDIEFILNEVLDYPKHYSSLPGCEEVTTDLTAAITEEAAKFAEQVLAPLNAVGDEEGCKWSPEGVTTPTGFKEAYQQFVEGGWPLLSAPEEFGGQGLPDSLNLVVSEMVSSSNVSWSGYTGLSHGAIKTLLSHGSEKQKEVYLPSRQREGYKRVVLRLFQQKPQQQKDHAALETKRRNNCQIPSPR